MRDSAHSPLNNRKPHACGLKAEAGHNRPSACRGRARGKTAAQPLRGVCVARVARHATCAAWTLRDSARHDGERYKQPVAERRKVPWQARMHGRARRAGHKIGRERSERLILCGAMEGASAASAFHRGVCARPHPRPTGGGRGGGDKTRRARKRANTHGKQECTGAAGGRRAASDLRRRHKLNPRGRPRPLDAAEGWLLQPSHASDTRIACQWRGCDTTAAANTRERATEG